MNYDTLTNQAICNLFDDADDEEEMIKYAIQMKRRLCAIKQPYEVRYKFLPNNHEIDHYDPVKVWATSPLAACQTLVDANDWRGQSMEFQVGSYHFTNADLE